jgi:alpha,alpha-trehalase
MEAAMHRTGPPRLAAAALGLILIAAPGCGPALGQGRTAGPSAASSQLTATVRYIDRAWDTLTRTLSDLPRAAVDPKMHPAGGKWPVYVPADADLTAIKRRLVSTLLPADLATIDLRVLPANRADIHEHGLLYLPHPYVVPGGRFNEMYGWDSYFIQLGLLEAGRLDLARDMVENHIYEIEHYGMVLNANRTYYLTRSQPPFLTRMILGVFDKTHDQAWLRSTLPAIDAYYAYWTAQPHLAGDTGLSRYFDLGEGPAPEVVSAERDAEGRTQYERARAYYRSHDVDAYNEAEYYDAAHDLLTARFYKGDRSMRESGFDPSERFGPFGVAIIDYAPVCLNVLLFRMEQDAGLIYRTLGNEGVARTWEERAARRHARFDQYLWDHDAGLYFDYDVVTRERRHYEFATTFYPLWAGLATAEQARRVVSHLPELEAPGGLMTSTRETGNQWDAPFGWAPLQIMAVEGLRRYGYTADADRLAREFVDVVVRNFTEHGTIVEKYDVRRRASDVSAGIKFGYSSNEIGFGWTNAAVLLLGRDGR